MSKFNEYKINLSEKNKDLVINYLEKIKIFIDNNSIDDELYTDIEERVFDKLKEEKNLNQLSIVKILKEVGEPEDIFSDYIEDNEEKEEKNKKRKLFYEKMINSGWTRSNKNAIFLGLSGLIAKKSGITSVWFIRVILLILIIPLGFSAWLYFLAGLFIPIENHDYKKTNELSYLWSNFLTGFIDIFSNLFSFVQKIIYSGTKTTYKGSKTLIGCFFIFLFYLFLLSIFIILASIMVFLLVLLSGYFTSFSFLNIDFFSTFPLYFMYGLIFGIISIFIFLIGVINYIFTKKSINKYILSFGLISFFIALFLGFSSLFNLVKKYSDREIIEKNYDFGLIQTQTGILNIDFSQITQDSLNYGPTSIRLEKSPGQNISIKLETSVLGNNEIVKKISDGISDIKMKNNGNELIFYTDSGKTFKQKVPFSLIRKFITLYLPENYQINLTNNYYTIYENIDVIKEERKYSLNHYNCFNSIIFFSKEENKFVCKLNQENLKIGKRSYLTDYLINNFNDFSPILHQNEYKRDYYNKFYGKVTYTDWNFMDFKWSDDEKNVEVIFGDYSLEIKANLSVEESSTGVIVNSFEIKNISQDSDYYDEKYYKKVDIINNFIK